MFITPHIQGMSDPIPVSGDELLTRTRRRSADGCATIDSPFAASDESVGSGGHGGGGGGGGGGHSGGGGGGWFTWFSRSGEGVRVSSMAGGEVSAGFGSVSAQDEGMLVETMVRMPSLCLCVWR